ncbi:hypothetical protein ACA910_000729 [Epithemia clementina (nom. ined.)]
MIAPSFRLFLMTLLCSAVDIKGFSIVQTTLWSPGTKRHNVLAAAGTEASSSFESVEQAQEKDDVAVVVTKEDEEEFLKRCKALCDLRNLPLEKVKNGRDLASVALSPVKPGRLFRTGRMSDATENDVNLLFNELNITTVVDLRSPTELKDDENLMREAVFGNFTNILWRERRGGCLTQLAPGQPPIKKRFWNRFKKQNDNNNKSKNGGNNAAAGAVEDDIVAEVEDDEEMIVDVDSCSPLEEIRLEPGRKERHFVSVMNELKYVKGTVSKVRKRDLTKSLLKSPGALVSRRVRNSVKKPFLDEINGGGLPMVNDMLLRYGAPGIKYVLELCADRRRHPIAFYCTAGKDRTGVISALILRLCGVPKESIVEDYTLSANVYAEMNDHKAMVGALSQRSLDPKTFLGAPSYVMEDTLDALEEAYGSVEEYLTSIGFGPEQQQKLKDACMN